MFHRHAILGFAMLCASTGFAQSRGTLSIDAVVDIKHPSSPVFSPDGRRLAFVWERAGVQNVYVSDLSNGSGDPRPLTAYNEGRVDALFWSSDGSRVLFDREGSLWTVDVNTGRDTRPLWNDAAPAYGYVPSPDGNRIAYSRERDLWVRPVQEGVEHRLTRTPERNEGGIAWSPDGTRIAFVTSSSERHENAPDYSGAKILYAWFDRRTGDVGVVTADGDGSPVSVFPDQIFRESAPRWIDDARLVFERVHDDTTRREIVVADALPAGARSSCARSKKNGGAFQARPSRGRSLRPMGNGSPSSAIAADGITSMSCRQGAVSPSPSPVGTSRHGAPPGLRMENDSRSTPTRPSTPVPGISMSWSSETIPANGHRKS